MKRAIWTKEKGNQIVDMTPDEIVEWEARTADWESKSGERKLKTIRKMRNKKLQETDYLANSDVVMPDNIKTWRQNLRDLPQNNTTEEQYDLILARDENKQLTHAVWSKP